jgi:hypothetical protein
VKYVVLHAPRPGRFAWRRERDGEKSRYLRIYRQVGQGREVTILQVY